MKKVFLITVLMYGIFATAQTFTLKSNELGGQATEKQMYNGLGCSGQNISPQLYWENPPEGTRSYAVTIFDEDAPTGSGWWHWVVFDIPANVKELKSNSGNIRLAVAPRGSIQSMTDFGAFGYGGPCPPEGSAPHKYTITIYALKTEKLGLEATANPALVGFTLGQNMIEKASLVFYCKK